MYVSLFYNLVLSQLLRFRYDFLLDGDDHLFVNILTTLRSRSDLKWTLKSIYIERHAINSQNEYLSNYQKRKILERNIKSAIRNVRVMYIFCIELSERNDFLTILCLDGVNEQYRCRLQCEQGDEHTRRSSERKKKLGY